MIKRTDDAGNWGVVDNQRNASTLMTKFLEADLPAAEKTAASALCEFTATGFQVKTTSTNWNVSGGTYIYMAFANSVYDHQGTFTVEEKIGIGTHQPLYELDVNGTVRAKEIIVSIDGWADYVFDDRYRLPPLDEVKRYIIENSHLPGFPPEKVLMKNGLGMSEMFALQMKKIEELSLYVLQLKETNDEIRNQNKQLSKRIEVLEKNNR